MARNRNRRAPKGKGEAASKTNSNNLAISGVQLLTTSNLSYGYPAGTTFEDSSRLKGLGYDLSSEIPGLGVFHLVPHVGYSDGPNSVINLAAKRLFSSFTFANGRNPAYQSADAVIVPLAVGQVASAYDFAIRAYRVLNTYIGMNRYFPKMVLESMCLDYDDFVKHIADFGAWLENLRFKLQSLYVPNNLPIIDEWRSAYRDIYVDEPNNPKAQFYMFVPQSFLMYNPTRYTTGGCLEPVDYLTFTGSPAKPTLYSFATFTAFVDAMVNILVYDDDVNKIMADIMLTYGPESVDQLNAVDLGSAIEFKYDPVVSATIHNGTVLAHTTFANNYGHSGVDSREIYQANNVIIHTPAWSTQSKYALMDHVNAQVFDSPTAEVNPLLNLAMSRMSILFPDVRRTNKHSTNDNEGPGWYCASGQAYATAKPQGLGVFSIKEFIIYKPSNIPGVFTYTLCDGTCPPGVVAPFYNGYDKFQNAPLLDCLAFTSGVSSNSAVDTMADYTLKAVYGDLHYYTMLEEADLRKMQETFILAQLSAGLRG